MQIPFGRYARIGAVALVVALAAAAGYFYWRENSPLLANKAEEEKYEAVAAFTARYEEAMRADTYGGKTPEETLRLFIAALEQGSIELASKYFALETNERDPDYLTRRKWEEALLKAKEENRLSVVLETIRKMNRSSRNLGTNDAVEYVTYGDNNVVEHALMLILNRQADVWKIESL